MADQPVSKSALPAALAARSATYRDHATLLDDVRRLRPPLVSAELDLEGVGLTSSDLVGQVHDAHRIIHEERGANALSETSNTSPRTHESCT